MPSREAAPNATPPVKSAPIPPCASAPCRGDAGTNSPPCRQSRSAKARKRAARLLPSRAPRSPALPPIGPARRCVDGGENNDLLDCPTNLLLHVVLPFKSHVLNCVILRGSIKRTHNRDFPHLATGSKTLLPADENDNVDR